jgi:exopolysaccharide production protein ExoZ
MQTIVAVQILRAVAALSVVFCHYNQLDLFLTGRRDDPIPLYFLASGVDLFFVISGFIMIYSSKALFAAPDGIRTFAVRRLARIVPLYWITTITYIFVVHFPLSLWPIMGSLFFIPYGTVGTQIVPIHGAGWTLNYEMMFYVLFSISLLWRRKIALFVLVLTLAIIAVLGQVTTPTSAPVRYWLDPIVLEFAFGMLIAIFYERGVCVPTSVQWLLICASAVTIYLTEYHIIGSGLPSAGRAFYWGLPCAAIFAALVLRTPFDKANRFVSTFTMLGNASYSLYLIHPIISVYILLAWQNGQFRSLPASLVAVGGVITSIILSIIAFSTIERPATRLLHRHSWTSEDWLA